MGSEKTLLIAFNLFNNPYFREQRAEEHPDTCAKWDARAATFVAMDTEGRFDDGKGYMTDDESLEFELISRAVLKMSGQ